MMGAATGGFLNVAVTRATANLMISSRTGRDKTKALLNARLPGRVARDPLKPDFGLSGDVHTSQT
jgi:hypothetical protein